MSSRAKQLSNLEIFKFREFGILMVLVVFVVLLSVATDTFLTSTNIINVVRQTVEIGIMAIGMTFVIICAEIDLSIGSIYGCGAMIAAYMIKGGSDPSLAFLVAILFGLGVGFLNGFLSTKARMPAFIVTLGTMQLFRSFTYGISGGYAISSFPEGATDSWVFRMGDYIGPIPVQVIIMVILFIIAHVVLKKTRFGFNVIASGGNQRAAQLGGINTNRIKTASFMICGALSAFAGMISIAFLKSVPTGAGEGREMDVIASVILGGASMAGGRGTILGTLIGALIMSVVKNGMILISIPAYYQKGFIGVILILAVLMDTLLNKRDKRGE